MEDMTSQLQNTFSSMSSGKTKKTKLSQRPKQLCDEEAAKLVNEEEISEAIVAAEQNGIAR